MPFLQIYIRVTIQTITRVKFTLSRFLLLMMEADIALAVCMFVA